jgi:hypothetical protein
MHLDGFFSSWSSLKKKLSEGGPSCIQNILNHDMGEVWRHIDPLVRPFVLLLLLHAAAACCFALDMTISAAFYSKHPDVISKKQK